MPLQYQPPCPALEALQRSFLAEALQEVLGSSTENLEAAGCDSRSLGVLRETAQVGTAATHPCPPTAGRRCAALQAV